MTNKLYKKYASSYTAATNNRDFKKQLELILNTYQPDNPCQSFIELFAGQSLHSIEALKKDGIDVWAADSSQEMKELAISQGFLKHDQYIVGYLPESILNNTGNVKFDCVACLYSAFSAISMQQVFELLYHLKSLLSDKGKIFIELHDVFYTMEYIANPVVQYQEVQNSEGQLVQYAWPSGKIKWDHYSHTAEVPITFNIQSADHTETVEFISIDHVYSAEEIIFIANLLDYESKVLSTDPVWAASFPGGIVLELSLRSAVQEP